MIKITAVTLSLFFLANIFAPQLNSISTTDMDNLAALLQNQPVVRYYNNIATLPIKILNQIFYDGGLQLNSNHVNKLPQKTKKSANHSSEYALVSSISKISVKRLSCNYFTIAGFFAANLKLPYMGPVKIALTDRLIFGILLLLLLRFQNFINFNSMFRNSVMLARGSIEDAFIAQKADSNPIKEIFDRVFLLPN
jgi:hypothetical protein